MKKSYIIGLLFIAVFGIFIYLGSYKFTENELYNKELFDVQTEESIISVDNKTEDVVTNKTDYILETYNQDDDSLVEEHHDVPVAFLGLTRSELISYLKEYEKSPDYHDIEKGFTAYDLLSFSSECIVLRKTYKNAAVSYKFFLLAEDDYITVYYSDLKTVYTYSDIKITDLPQELQTEIKSGKYIETIEELYDFLESYSS